MMRKNDKEWKKEQKDFLPLESNKQLFGSVAMQQE